MEDTNTPEIISTISSATSILSDVKSLQVFSARLQIFSMHPTRIQRIAILSEIMEKSYVTKSNYTVPLEDCTLHHIFRDDKQYFPSEIISLKNECFLDCGAYIGDTIQTFLKESEYQFDSIFSFEPSKSNYNLCMESLLQYEPDIRKRIKVFNYGLAEKESILYFSQNQNPSCGGIEGKTLAHDNSTNLFEKCDIRNINNVLTPKELSKISFVKMDVEGNELDILKSLEDIIKNNNPKLAISVYHKPKDFFEIPLYIKSLMPDYKIYLRHHSNWEWETVCYAVP